MGQDNSRPSKGAKSSGKGGDSGGVVATRSTKATDGTIVSEKQVPGPADGSKTQKSGEESTGTSLVAASTGFSPTKSPRGMTPGMFIHQQEGVFSERYQGLKVLGKGSFGEVILCRDRVTSEECAVKVISKRTLKRGADPKSLLREVDLLKQLDHPNIMRLYEFFQDSGYFYLVGEVYSGGELFDEIISRKRFSEQDAASLIQQVLSGIAYMHRNKIVHRDLKPENLLLETKDKNTLIKIIDFGLSTHFENEGGKKMKDKIGTAYYIAPEVLHGTYDEKCDVWSSGVILYILLSGCPPFYGSTEFDILKRVEAGKYSFGLPQWRKVSESAKDLIRKMLTYSPSNRATALECLEHEWIHKMTDSTLTELPALESTMENMRQFQSTQRVTQAALLYIGSTLTTQSERKDLTEIFRKLDKNGDGQLDRQELKEGYKELMKMQGHDITKFDEESIASEVEAVLNSIDFDRNGFIEYSEFVTVAIDRKVLLSETRLRKAFTMFDLDNSGKISSDELLRIFVQMGNDEADCEKFVRDADKNKDGEVDFEEFCALLRKILGEPAVDS